MEPSKENLLEDMLNAENSAPRPHQTTAALVRWGQSTPPVKANLEAFAAYIPAETDQLLASTFRFALLGLSVGFADRHLTPYLDEHLAIIPPLLDDIQGVFDRLRKLNAEYDPDEFRFRAYDYGIHKAYYLDWCLYLSKDCY